MKKVMFVEIGMGVDLHGQDVNTACVRAVRDAIGHNSMPGMRSVLKDEDINNMVVEITLAVPVLMEQVDEEAVKAVVPYGQKTVKLVVGGLVAKSGVVLPDKGDTNDDVIIVNAVVEVGY